jgi:5,6-dimethylbenzimidazole synthase
MFDDTFRAQLRDLLIWRRDVRQFRLDPLPEELLLRLLQTACLAPSVGLSQPWRFVLVDDPERRARIRANFAACNAAALAATAPDRAARYARLKLAGLDQAPRHLAVFADRSTAQGHGLGRLTMPQTIEYSVVTAVHTLWLVARAEGIGLGWVSIIDPEEVAGILDVPPAWIFVGYFCLGYPAAEDNLPTLQRQGWEARRPLSAVLTRR